MCVSAIAGAIAVGGLATSGASAVQQMHSRQKTTAASIDAERLRERQMNLETQRRTREAIRKEQVARSMTAARAVNQGAGFGSSVTGGAYGQQVGQLGRDLVGLRENQQIGAGLFDANARVAQYQGDTATYEGVGRLGAGMTASAMNLGQIFGGASGPSSSGFNSAGIGPFSTFVQAGNTGANNYSYYP